MAHADNVRRYFPATRHVAYLNTGTFGAMPDVAVEAMQTSLARGLAEGRGMDYYAQLARVKLRIREQLGHLFHVDPQAFTLTDSTTDAMNLVSIGLNLQAGDEVILTDAEYPGAVVTLFAQKQSQGAVLRVIDGMLDAEAMVAAVERTCTARTRLLVCSHVSFQTGHRFPIEELARVAHEKGAYILVDGAQGAGADPLDLARSGIDFYALPGQKWLCGPDGTGALYVRPDLWSVLEPGYMSYKSLTHGDAYTWTGSYLTWPDARRYEHTTLSLESLVGWYESMQFLRVNVGWDFVYTRVKGLSGHLLDQLLDFDFVRVLTPRDQRVGLVSFQLLKGQPESFVKEAAGRDISIRSINQRRAVRVSTGCYNSEDDIARLVQLLTEYGKRA